MTDVSDVISVGQEVRPRVMSIELDTGRIKLTLKSAEAEAKDAQRMERRRAYQDRDSGEGGADGAPGGGGGMRNKFDGQRRVGGPPRAAGPGGERRSGAPLAAHAGPCMASTAHIFSDSPVSLIFPASSSCRLAARGMPGPAATLSTVSCRLHLLTSLSVFLLMRQP